MLDRAVVRGHGFAGSRQAQTLAVDSHTPTSKRAGGHWQLAPTHLRLSAAGASHVKSRPLATVSDHGS